VVKERALRLRQKGQLALVRHLAGQVGARRRVLVESDAMGRTEHFTPVRLPAAAAPGSIVEALVTGHDGRHLLAA